MPESLADSLRIAVRSLPPGLVPSGERERLLRQARGLAPVHCAGFECRLTGAPGRVDLQQRITPRDFEPVRLAAYLLATGLDARPAWRRIRNFMLAWTTGELARQVSEIWLEYETAGGRGVQPSVFVSFKRRGGRGDLAPVLRQAIALLAPADQARRLADAALEIGGRLPGSARIYDIGLMARRQAVLRVNVGGFPAANLAAVLAALGWDRRERARIGEFAREAVPCARHFKLALDWHGKLLPRAGLELIPGGDPEAPVSAAASARWRGLFAWLGARKACDGGRAAALLDWPGQDEPPACRMPWPESLVAESVLRGPRAFSVLGRRLSHVKVDFVPRRRPAAKAYFGFGRLWRGASPVMTAPLSVEDLRAAMARGTAFLLAQRSSDGFWRDFRHVNEGSDEWTSAYVAAALARTGAGEARHAARETWNLLARSRARPGWGYNRQIPVDADSTLWTLRLAQAVRRTNDPAAQSALRLLRRHRSRDGGVATFLETTLGDSRSTAGWCHAHAEVTAAAGALPGFGRSSTQWLLRSQQPDGRWDAYWYDEDAFATALAAEHLASRRGPAPRRALMRAARWAMTRIAADGSVAAPGVDGGSAFAAACCLRILLAARDPESPRAAADRLGAWLAAAQRVEGGWQGSTCMYAPLPGDTDPAASGLLLGFAWDECGYFTTATVLEALGRLAASGIRG